MTSLAVVGAVVGSVLGPSAALAAPSELDTTAHSYGFDHTLADSLGGVDAVVHGAVGFAAGRLDPPDSGDGAVRFDGRPLDYLSIPRPAFDYGAADFTLDVWISTTAKRTETILDTGGCGARAGGFALVLSGDGRLAVRVNGESEDDGNDHNGSEAAGAMTTPVAASGGRVGAASREDDSPTSHDPSGPARADDGRWHEATLTRTGTAIVVRLDGAVDQTLTLAALTDLGGVGDVRIGRGWCGDDHGFTGELDDLTVTPAPPVALPEAPLAAVLPVSAAAVAALVVARRRARRRRPPAPLRRR